MRLSIAQFIAVLCSSVALGQSIEAKVSGPLAPDGKTQVQIDLPDSQQKANISSRGLGCCVFRSLDHAARWQNEPVLYDFPEWMVSKGIPGGGYPEKVSKLIPQIARDRGLPAPQFLQVEGSDLKIIELATANGLLPCTTYGVSPTGRYGGQTIAHMVNTPHAKDGLYAVLDNNYVGRQKLEWANESEYRRSYLTNGGGWTVVLLKWGPPPPPRN